MINTNCLYYHIAMIKREWLGMKSNLFFIHGFHGLKNFYMVLKILLYPTSSTSLTLLL